VQIHTGFSFPKPQKSAKLIPVVRSSGVFLLNFAIGP